MDSQLRLFYFLFCFLSVHLVGKYQSKVFEDRSVNFCLGEGSDSGVVDGIEIALPKFKKGEKSLLKLKPEYAFGEAGKPDFEIPPCATVEYEVELKSFEKVCCRYLIHLVRLT